MTTDKKIRLFVDAHGFDNEYQGSRSFLKGLYTEVAKEKNVQLFMAAYDKDNLEKNFPGCENIHFLKYKSKKRYFRLAIDIPLLIRKYKIDYAHFQYIVPLVKNCRQIVTIHDALFKEDPASFPLSYRIMKSFLFKRSARLADLITTVSPYSRNSIIQHLNGDPARISVITNAVAPDFFEPYDKKAAKSFIHSKYGLDKFLLCVSRFEPRKNQLLLLQEFLSLKLYSKGYQLVFLGYESLRTDGLQALLKSLEPAIRQQIFISSEVNNEELLHFYRAADLFIYPSQAEGFGIPPLEAAAVRIPVICSNRSAMRDFSFFGAGHIDPLLPGSLNSAITAALSTNSSEEQLQAISNEIERKYSWQKAAEDFYQLILGHSREYSNQPKNERITDVYDPAINIKGRLLEGSTAKQR